MIALDIWKAFDKVWHKGLLHKLRSYGVSGKVFDIIKSFHSNRSLKVVLDGQHSLIFRITSGVPQGSILGPILFLIFINYLPDNLLSKVAIFADDTSLYSYLNEKSNLSDQTELSDNLEHDLSSVSSWGSKWLVTFNSKKKNYSLLIAIEIQLIFPSPCPVNLFLTLPLSVFLDCLFLMILLGPIISILLLNLPLWRSGFSMRATRSRTCTLSRSWKYSANVVFRVAKLLKDIFRTWFLLNELYNKISKDLL